MAQNACVLVRAQCMHCPELDDKGGRGQKEKEEKESQGSLRQESNRLQERTLLFEIPSGLNAAKEGEGEGLCTCVTFNMCVPGGDVLRQGRHLSP